MATLQRVDTPVQTIENFENSDLYANIYKHVEKYMSRYDQSHDFKHTLRVLALAKHIMNEEMRANPDRKLREDIIILSALLHDVGDKKYAQPGEDPEFMVQDLLTQYNYHPRLIAKVALIVKHVSYSNEVKRPQLVRAMVSAHPELGVVQDADRLDAIGAIGVGRAFSYGAAKQPDRGLQGTIGHFTEKLEKLEGLMKTETGKKLAVKRTQRIKQFREWWDEENAAIK